MKTIKMLNSSYQDLTNQEISVQGWIRTNRYQKEFGFINLNDGSSLSTFKSFMIKVFLIMMKSQNIGLVVA